MSNDTPLKRRRFLTTVGSISVAAIAGCSSDSDSNTTSTESPTQTSVDTQSETSTDAETTESPTTETETPTQTTTQETATPDDPTKNVDVYDYEVLIEQREKYKGAEIDATVEYIQPYKDYEGFQLANADETWPFILDIDGDFTQGDVIHFVGTITEYRRPSGSSDYVPFVNVSSYERK